jgi:hypothetical protein
MREKGPAALTAGTSPLATSLQAIATALLGVPARGNKTAA